MAVIFLESKDNAKIKHLRGLIELSNARKKHQQTVLEGTHLCLAWLQQQKKKELEKEKPNLVNQIKERLF